MPNLEFVPLKEHSVTEARQAGENIHALVAKTAVAASLKARNLRGVLARHSQSPEQSADLMQALLLSEAQQKMQVFVVKSVAPEVATVGMATIQDDLSLYYQKLPLPARLTRNSVLGVKIDAIGANVSAWTDFSREGSAGVYFEQREAYEFLRAERPACWTLVTDALDKSEKYVSTALGDAGFTNPFRLGPDAGRARFDELENRWTPAPISRLFTGEPV